MTPEEPWARIENAIQVLLEVQARHEGQLEKQTAGIRDLIVVSRTLIDSQRPTDTRLNTLVDTVDRLSSAVNTLVNGLQKPNGNQ